MLERAKAKQSADNQSNSSSLQRKGRKESQTGNTSSLYRTGSSVSNSERVSKTDRSSTLSNSGKVVASKSSGALSSRTTEVEFSSVVIADGGKPSTPEQSPGDSRRTSRNSSQTSRTGLTMQADYVLGRAPGYVTDNPAYNKGTDGVIVKAPRGPASVIIVGGNCPNCLVSNTDLILL